MEPSNITFDISSLSGSREARIEHELNRFEDLLRETIGNDRYGQCFQTTEFMRLVLWSLFDEEHGADVVNGEDFIRTIHEARFGEMPPVSNKSLETSLGRWKASPASQRVADSAYGFLQEIGYQAE